MCWYYIGRGLSMQILTLSFIKYLHGWINKSPIIFHVFHRHKTLFQSHLGVKMDYWEDRHLLLPNDRLSFINTGLLFCIKSVCNQKRMREKSSYLEDFSNYLENI